MIKLGTSSPLSHENPVLWAKKHKELGLEAINFPGNCEDDPKLTEEYIEAAKTQKLIFAEVGIWRNTMSPDSEEKEKAIQYSIGQLQLADRIGARCCVNIVGAKGQKWDGAYKDNYSKETWNETVKTIRRIIDAVNPQNTFFTIEPMPWMIPDGPDEYLRLIEAVERDRFAVHLDVFNWITSPKRYFFNEEFVDECFEKLGILVKSCHIKDVKMHEDYTLRFEETYPGNGGINIGHLIETACKFDPEMTFIIEHLNSDEEYLRSVKYVKGLIKE